MPLQSPLTTGKVYGKTFGVNRLPQTAKKKVVRKKYLLALEGSDSIGIRIKELVMADRHDRLK